MCFWSLFFNTMHRFSACPWLVHHLAKQNKRGLQTCLRVCKNKTETTLTGATKCSYKWHCDMGSSPIMCWLSFSSWFPKGMCKQMHHVTVLSWPFWTNMMQINPVLMNSNNQFFVFSHLPEQRGSNSKFLNLLSSQPLVWFSKVN